MSSEKPLKLPGTLRLMAVLLVCLASVAAAAKPKPDDDSLLNLVLSSLALDGPILIGTAIFLRASGKTWRNTFGFSNPPVGRAILLGLCAALLFLPVGMVLQEISIRILTWLNVSTEAQVAVEEFNKSVFWVNRAYLVFLAIVLAPFAEEIMFRGILYAVIRKSGFPRLALWISAFCFAVIHGNAPIFLPLLVLGLVLAWLYERTGNLLASITAHSVFNAINIVFIFKDQIDEFLRRHSHF